MVGLNGLYRRLEALESRIVGPEEWAEACRLGAELDLDPGEILVEAQRLGEYGEDVLDALAAELGVDPDQLLAEARRIAA